MYANKKKSQQDVKIHYSSSDVWCL
jgi:hypothetical protein